MMAIHITNINGVFYEDTTVKNQHFLADVGHAMGFYQMGVYRYPAAEEPEIQLSSRLDGVIASLHAGDMIFVQLPTGNGTRYDVQLLHKLKGYADTKVIAVVHEDLEGDDLSAYAVADVLAASSMPLLHSLQRRGFNAPNCMIRRINWQTDRLLAMGYLTEMMQPLLLEKQSEQVSDDPELVHVCFGLHDKDGNYTSNVGAVMLSILEHTTAGCCFHILHDETLNADNRRKLVQLVGRFGSLVRFHRIDKTQLDVKNEWFGLYSIGCMFRLMIPEVMPELSKVIYLDADLLFCRDIAELWATDISDYALAAVHDVGFERGIMWPSIVKQGHMKVQDYFNSGVLYMNLDRIRSMGCLRDMAVQFLLDHPESFLPDQDALNYIYRDCTLLLDSGWNRFVRYERGENKQLRDLVYHFVGAPFIIFSSPAEYEREYMSVRVRTPWGYGPVEEAWVRGVGCAFDHVYQLQGVVKVLDAGRKKIFYGPVTMSMVRLMELLTPGEGDYFIDTDPAQFGTERLGLPVKDISSLQEEKRDQFVIFLLPDASQGHAMEQMYSLGMEMGRDYFVIPRLMTEEQGGYNT